MPGNLSETKHINPTENADSKNAEASEIFNSKIEILINNYKGKNFEPKKIKSIIGKNDRLGNSKLDLINQTLFDTKFFEETLDYLDPKKTIELNSIFSLAFQYNSPQAYATALRFVFLYNLHESHKDFEQSVHYTYSLNDPNKSPLDKNEFLRAILDHLKEFNNDFDSKYPILHEGVKAYYLKKSHNLMCDIIINLEDSNLFIETYPKCSKLYQETIREHSCEQTVKNLKRVIPEFESALNANKPIPSDIKKEHGKLIKSLYLIIKKYIPTTLPTTPTEHTNNIHYDKYQFKIPATKIVNSIEHIENTILSDNSSNIDFDHIKFLVSHGAPPHYDLQNEFGKNLNSIDNFEAKNSVDKFIRLCFENQITDVFGRIFKYKAPLYSMVDTFLKNDLNNSASHLLVVQKHHTKTNLESLIYNTIKYKDPRYLEVLFDDYIGWSGDYTIDHPPI